VENYTGVIRPQDCPQLCRNPGRIDTKDRCAGVLLGRRRIGARRGAPHSQRVANANPTAMKPIPTSRFFCPRSLNTHTESRLLDQM